MDWDNLIAAWNYLLDATQNDLRVRILALYVLVIVEHS